MTYLYLCKYYRKCNVFCFSHINIESGTDISKINMMLGRDVLLVQIWLCHRFLLKLNIGAEYIATNYCFVIRGILILHYVTKFGCTELIQGDQKCFSEERHICVSDDKLLAIYPVLIHLKLHISNFTLFHFDKQIFS